MRSSFSHTAHLHIHKIFNGTGRPTISAAAQSSRRASSAAKPRRKPPRAAKKAKKSMKVAVNGCGHGDLDRIYHTIGEIERQQNIKVDLLLCCGDFQAMRNTDDLECFACPPKYRALKDFHKYYSGQKKAPIPTLFIGGNHEAVNHLWELYHGGWAAPNIRYLGHAGVIRFGGLRIGGMSGIYNHRHYTMGHFERPPYSESTKRSAYHIRDLEVYRLLKVKEPLDVFLSHDWPQKVPHYGDLGRLLKRKPYFKADIESGALGSPPAWQLLQSLQPRYWFSGHLHVGFSAAVPLGPAGALPPGDKSARRVTRFLAMDKPLPRRQFVQVVDIPVSKPGPKQFAYDAEWLAILRETHDLMNLGQHPTRFPTPLAAAPAVEPAHREFVDGALQERGAAVPLDFVATADVHRRGKGRSPTSIPVNPQTEAVFDLIGQPWNLGGGGGAGAAVVNDEEIDIGDDIDSEDERKILFEPVEINTFDPYAISDARDSEDVASKRPKLSDRLRQVSAAATTEAGIAVPAANPEEIDLGNESS